MLALGASLAGYFGMIGERERLRRLKPDTRVSGLRIGEFRTETGPSLHIHRRGERLDLRYGTVVFSSEEEASFLIKNPIISISRPFLFGGQLHVGPETLSASLFFPTPFLYFYGGAGAGVLGIWSMAAILVLQDSPGANNEEIVFGSLVATLLLAFSLGWPAIAVRQARRRTARLLVELNYLRRPR